MVAINKTWRACVVLGIGACFGSAGASPPPVSQIDASVAVSYRDLDLAAAPDIVILYRRIQVAAAKLCGPRDIGGPDIDSTLYRDCVSAAVARAVTAVDRPGLSAYHRAQLRR
jgi:UrcA family protein